MKAVMSDSNRDTLTRREALTRGLAAVAGGAALASVPARAFANVPAGPYWLVAAADQPGDEGPFFLDFTAKP